jgi:hypothetical protein
MGDFIGIKSKIQLLKIQVNNLLCLLHIIYLANFKL